MPIIKTWLDIDRIVREKTNGFTQLPTEMVRIDCSYYVIEIVLPNFSDKAKAVEWLKEWFGEWFDSTKEVIQLDIGDATIPVEFVESDSQSFPKRRIRPFWESMAYMKNQSAEEAQTEEVMILPPPFPENFHLIAFHSFKGGVGRTSHLVAYLFALIDQARMAKKDFKILVIDADLEAPGLTYWQRRESLQPTVSFLDFLEAYHYAPTDKESVIEFYARELEKSYQDEYGFYFLPACLRDTQLLDIRILPEHLGREINSGWGVSDVLYQLAKALKVNYVLIDLRAGLSEIASPILFDPRVERYLLTTLSEQSISGTTLVLEQLSKPVATRLKEVREGRYSDPTVIIGMVPQELATSSVYLEAEQRLREAYQVTEEEDIVNEESARLKIEQTFFAQELLYLADWSHARNKLKGTSVSRWASNLVEDLFPKDEEVNEEKLQVLSPVVASWQTGFRSSPEPRAGNFSLEEVKQLKKTCEKYVYAEKGESDDLLITSSLRNLGQNHINSLPRVVAIGAKGAGKTFNYLQLAHFQSWQSFLAKIVPNAGITENTEDSFIFPLLQSSDLSKTAMGKVDEAREAFLLKMGKTTFFHSDLVEKVNEAISCNWKDQNKWLNFWIGTLCLPLNLSFEQPDLSNQERLVAIDNHLKQKQVRVIFLCDGLENLLVKAVSDENQQTALRAFLEIPKRLAEIRQSHLGIIIFLRRDLVRYALSQNAGQFEHLYRPYDLVWDFESFLRLTLWIGIQAKVMPPCDSQLLISEISQILNNRLWGKKLGKDNSKEAITENWIHAALTDFSGRLQARDVVRFLLYSAKYTLDHSEMFEKWNNSRLLPPSAVRDAIEPCSKEKVKEVEEEYPLFKDWVNGLSSLTNKSVPFNPKDLEMSQETIELLTTIGVIYEDKERRETARFYIPEIFRAGLGFTYEARGRKRVLTLKNKVMND